MATLKPEDLSELVLEINAEAVKKELVSKYPTKIARKRAKQIVVNEVTPELSVPEIQSNVRTVPGLISQRGCTYAGCKGVVLGPTRDILNLTHGPIGCGFYSWLTRRNQTRPKGPKDHNFMTYCFSTDMQEEQIIFGGEKKLKQAIQEAYDTFKPKAIGIFATCPVGLIGDDIHAVAREMKEQLGINVFGFSCEGYKGVSQSAGHHIANNGVFTHIVGLDDAER
jgi:nitrogenase molybdenum-iron protein alpha chain